MIEDPREREASFWAARKGCSRCGATITFRGGKPFTNGSDVGRFWCMECWTLYWTDHPEDLADDDSRKYNHREAELIRRRRTGKLIFEENNNRVFVTDQGLLRIDFEPLEGDTSGNDYDPSRFALLMQAMKVIERRRLPGFGSSEV